MSGAVRALARLAVFAAFIAAVWWLGSIAEHLDAEPRPATAHQWLIQILLAAGSWWGILATIFLAGLLLFVPAPDEKPRVPPKRRKAQWP